MLTPDQNTQIKDLVNSAQTILIFFPSDAKEDVQMAAKALHLCLSSLQGKDVNLLSPQVVDSDSSQVAEVKTKVGNKNLQISFPYTEGMVDKVSYDIDEETNRFYLLIQPSTGTKPLDYKQIEYAYTGAEADLVFLVGVSDFDKLEHLYEGYENMYEDATVVALNTYKSSIGDVKIDGSGKTGLSEVVLKLLEGLELALSVDVSTQLLSGIESVTDNFASLTATAETFEIAAKLMRMGARRSKKKQVVGKKQASFAQALGEKKAEKLVTKKPISKKTLTPKKSKKSLGGLDHQPGVGGK